MLAAAASLDPNTLVPAGGLGLTVGLVLRILWRTNSDARANEQNLRDSFAAERERDRLAHEAVVARMQATIDRLEGR